MTTLGPVELLRLWDAAGGVEPAERAFLVAATADPPMTPGQVAALPVGRCHARLLEVRTAWLSEGLEATSGCPACGQDTEFELRTTDLLLLADKIVDQPEPLLHQGERVRWRLPTGADVAAAVDGADLLQRCVDQAECDASLREAVVAAMAAADPLAEVVVDVTCPSCRAEFAVDVDLPTFVWAELDARARRLLLEVDALARTYGWREADVLALSDPRRAAYLRILAEGTP